MLYEKETDSFEKWINFKDKEPMKGAVIQVQYLNTQLSEPTWEYFIGQYLYEISYTYWIPKTLERRWKYIPSDKICPSRFQKFLQEETSSALSKDSVNSPSHYTQGGIEVIDYLEAKLNLDGYCGFMQGNVIKYLSRAAHKNGLEDIKKAQWYLNKLVSTLEKELKKRD